MQNTEDDYKPSPGCLLNQKGINRKMRNILVNWLVDVHLKFKLLPETLYLTINLLDRYCEKEQVVAKKY
jgi:cyclin B